MKAYKVVYKENGKYYSSCVYADNKYYLEYPLGKIVIPKIGKIFLCDNYPSAKKFANIFIYKKGFVVLEVEAEKIEKGNYEAFHEDEESIELFWKKNSEVTKVTCMDCTILAKSVKVIKEM